MGTPPRSDDPKADVRSAAEEARRQTEAARVKMSDAGQSAQHEAEKLGRAAREEAWREAERQKQAASESIHDFAEAVRRAGDDLAERDQTTAARFVREAAGGLEGLSRSFSRQSPEDMLHGIRDFGRRNPTAFIAGSLLAGLALGRFAQSSADRAHHEGGSYPAPSTGEEYQVKTPQPTAPESSASGPLTPTSTSVGPGPGSPASVSGVGPTSGS